VTPAAPSARPRLPLFTPFLQRRRFAVVAPYLRGDVLDLSCGNGAIARLLQPGQYYLGTERRPQTVERLRGLHPGREFAVRDLERDDLALDRQFDTVLLIAVLEHLDAPERVLRQLPACLKAGGRVLITTPTPLGHRLHRLGARLGVFHLGAAHEHKQIFTRPTLAAAAESAGLRALAYRAFLLGGNQLLVCAGAQADP
jgi:SAM-dependent methyltransferase